MPLRPSLLLAACALVLGACATLPTARVEALLAAGDPRGAAEAVSAGEREYGEKARVLFLMDRAFTTHLSGDWKESNAAIEEAAARIEELHTKSLRAEAASFLVNDMSLPYRGEHYERVMLHVLGMLNYAALGDRDSALVEARRADALLKARAAELGEGKRSYREDALARYVAAVLYEKGNRQELEDAWLDYRKADEAFGLYASLYGTPKPARLKADLQRMAEGLGERERLAAYVQRDGVQAYRPLAQTRKDAAELVVLLYEGRAPAKVSVAMNVPVNLADGTAQYFTLALPKALPRLGSPPEAVLSAPGAQPAAFELFQDLQAIAVRDLEEKGGALLAKATARALAKFQAARAVQNKAREAGGAAELIAFLGTNVFTLASEQADTRGWRTLPGRIWLARLALPPGQAQAQVVVDGQAQDLPVLELKPGEKRFVVFSLP